LATGVNENGDIVGWGDTADRRYAIKWSLVPEPATSVGGLFGAVALALICRRRQSAQEISL
jgi:PEP-CTERM motif